MQKTYERQAKELEMKDTQLESLRSQNHKDQVEIRELRAQLDEVRLDAERMRKDREKRQDAEMMEGKTKEQLSREKHELLSQLSELQHQFDVFKTQKQTEAHKNEQLVRDAQSHCDILEKVNKKQISEIETLQRDYTSVAVKLKQQEVQVQYLESSN